MSSMAGAGSHLNDPKEKIGNLGEIQGSWQDKREVGSCNFCRDDRYLLVLVVQGNSTQVRFCRKCWSKLQLDAKKK